MVPEPSVLGALVPRVHRVPLPPPQTRRGRPAVSSDRRFLQALVIMLVTHLPRGHPLLAVLDPPTPEMRRLRPLLREHGRSHARETCTGQFPARCAPPGQGPRRGRRATRRDVLGAVLV